MGGATVVAVLFVDAQRHHQLALGVVPAEERTEQVEQRTAAEQRLEPFGDVHHGAASVLYRLVYIKYARTLDPPAPRRSYRGAEWRFIRTAPWAPPALPLSGSSDRAPA
ncbi:hypothetical protein, partial [Pseudomonas aeruginosa]|uniref:hypothetical protein n=1 Tax=Pseudomonas aeruginosa TaxID=287 RepID=UPI001F08A05F